LSEGFLQRSLLAQGMLAAPGTSEEFRSQLLSDRERWTRVLRTVAVKH